MELDGGGEQEIQERPTNAIQDDLRWIGQFSNDDLLKFLNVSSEINTLPTTYGELHPPLGKHRLKVVEFTTVLLEVGGEAAEKELIQSSAIQIILDQIFKYPFNNSLHHHQVENLVASCLESKNTTVSGRKWICQV